MARLVSIFPFPETLALKEAPCLVDLQHVVVILAGTMINVGAEFLGDGLGIAGMAVGRDLLGLDLGDRPGGAEECLGRDHIAGFAQVNID